MKRYSSLIFSAAFLLFCQLTFAQQTGTLKGVITDTKTGETLIGASVTLEADKTKGSAADFNGNYSLTLPAGIHKVVISFTGYNSKTKEVTITAGQTTTLNIDLAVTAKELGAVVVSAGKFEQKVEDLTVSVEIISPELVASKGTTSAETAINQTPGVQIIDSEPQIRGGSGYSFGAGSRVAVLVDDLPLLSGDAGRPSWGFIPVENLEQIEVIKGASSVLYGSAALSGIINVRTAYPKDTPQTKITLLVGMYDTPKRKETKWWDGMNPMMANINFFHSRKIGNLDFVIGGNIIADDGHVGPSRTDTLLPGNSWGTQPAVYPKSTVFSNVGKEEGLYNKRFRINTNLRYRFPKVVGLAIGVNFNFSKGISKGALLWESGTTGIYRPFPGSDTKTDQITYNIDPFVTYFGRKNGNRHTLRTRMFHQNNANTNNQANKSTLYYGEYQFQRKVKSMNDLIITAGAMGTYSSGVAQLYAGIDPSGENSYVNAAAYVQIDKKFWKKLNLTLGGRYEFFQVNESEKQGVPVFRAGLSLPVAKATFIRGSFGQGFRFPTIAERFIRTNVGGINIFPNADIEPEKAWNAELGIKQGIKIGKFYGYLDLAGFWQQYYNTVEFTFGKWDTLPGFQNIANNLGFKSVNTGNTRVVGVDFSVLGQGKFNDNFGINILAGYTYTLPQTLNPDKLYNAQSPDTLYPVQLAYNTSSLDTTNNILKYRFQHMVKMDVEFNVYGVSLGISYRFNSFMQNADKIFYDLDAGVIPTDLKGIGLIESRGDNVDRTNPQWTLNDPARKAGTSIVDLRLAYSIKKAHKLAFIVNNLFNEEYALRPLNINAMRMYNLQYTLTF
ncbi:MAG: Vitamin B12 transporter BtuB [Bacteroidia bacterium]|nr:Vitamin B12 transporter BtuB [Bacteroidia bacterium]